MKRLIDDNLIYSYEDAMMKLGLEVVVLMMRDIFNDPQILQGEMCVIFNDPSFGFPMFATGYPLGIRTSIKEEGDYGLLLSQLSHELTHYIFRKYKKDKDKIAKRYEEIVAEAVAMYVLYLAPQYWNTLSITFTEKDYVEKLENDFKTILGYYQRNQMPLKEPISKARWRMLERNYTLSRERHFKEVLYAFQILMEKKISLKKIMVYEDYLNKNGSIDFKRWHEVDPDISIEMIAPVQPTISNN